MRASLRHTAMVMAAAFAAGLTLSACEDEGPAEQAGESIDESAEEAGEALEGAGDAAEDAAD